MSGTRKLQVRDFHPLHFEVLKTLPEEGQTLGLHKLAKTVRQVRDEINDMLPEDTRLPSSRIMGVLRSMEQSGFVSNTKLTGTTLGWQITSKGKQVLTDTQEQ